MKPNRLWVLFLIDTFSFTLVFLSWYHTQKKKKMRLESSLWNRCTVSVCMEMSCWLVKMAGKKPVNTSQCKSDWIQLMKTA